MKLKNQLPLFAAIAALAICDTASAWTAVSGRKEIRVNKDVTTLVVMHENIKMVDVSTPNIIGNQCTDNVLRIKPAPQDSIDIQYENNTFLGTVTLIGERSIAQYDIVYEPIASRAETYFTISNQDTRNYSNPEVSMTESEMAKFAWAIYGSKRKFNNIKKSAHGIKAQIYNIYSIGNFFFIDYGLENKTNIDYSINEVHVTLTDKKQTKATNSQTIEINPVYVLNNANKFKKYYRQVMVLEKLTFPDEKEINITISENQISGRVITLKMEYDDVLNADSFDMTKAPDFNRNVRQAAYNPNKSFSQTQSNITDRQTETLKKKNTELNASLLHANKQITKLNEQLDNLRLAYSKLETAYKGANQTIEDILSKAKVN